MQGWLVRRYAAIFAVVALVFAAAPLNAGEITSRMRTVSGVFESNGYRLEPVYDVEMQSNSDDLAPPQAYEIIRPDSGKPVTIGRLFTSCSCIQLEAHKRTFQPGERAILQLRNIRPTPQAGQVYAIFVQLTGPVRTTLRFDTFVQSGVGIGSKPEPATPAAPATASASAVPTPPLGSDPVPGVNNELAAALSAINAHPEATGDLFDEAIGATVEKAETAANDLALSLPDGDDVLESLGEARSNLEAMIQADAQAVRQGVHSDVDAARQAVGAYMDQDPEEAAADLVADIGGDLPDFNAPLSAGQAAPADAVATAEIVVQNVQDAEPVASPEENLRPPAPEPAVTEATPLTEDQILQLQRLALIQAEEQARQLAAQVQQLAPAPAVEPAPAVVEQQDPVIVSLRPEPVAEPVAAPVVEPAPEPAPAPVSAPAAVAPAPARAAPALSGRPIQAVSLITIGVRDMSASTRFYEAVGWQRAARGKYDQTAFFQLNGQVLALYPIGDLLLEQNMTEARPSPGGITLALHVQDKNDVAAIYQRFVDAGGKPLRPPAEMASGAVSSYVADPDGNPWEISWVPQFHIDPTGGLWLP